MPLPDLHRLPTTPTARPSSVVTGDRWRITMLSPRLVRLEWSPTGVYEDRATQVVINRTFPDHEFTVTRTGPSVRIANRHLQLDYDGEPFSPQGLRVAVNGVSSHHSVWRHGQVEKDNHFGIPANLRGTARTLDEIDGACLLEPGLVSGMGYAVLDDTASLAFDDDGWLAPREPGNLDLYVFAHGHDFPGALSDFYALTGPQPLLPRYALGNWWSRYHAYTDAEYRELMERFDAAGIPFSVAVVDMDWHITDVDPAISSGWTGYTWNRDLFPAPADFLGWLHARGMRVCLNVHPADGVCRHEEAYERVATAVGIDPASGQPASFDLTDERFRDAYFRLLHHPLEDEGVDFWWLDWQQGPYSKVPGLDPLWLLNHLHFLDSARRGGRPLTFSRYAGPGSHRYPVGFSGDSVVSWASLEFQPYFTATASNIGYGWWSHDIGGHMFGVKDDELATRWVQLGCFSPINRLHSTNNPFNSKEPWRFGPVAEAVQTEFLRFRHRLLPYLYTMNERAHTAGRPIVEPLYWHGATMANLAARTSFRFGSELHVAAITSPVVPGTRLGTVTTELGPGPWIDVFTGLVYDGGRAVTLHRPLGGYPVLARAGGIVPLTGAGDLGVANPDSLEIRVYAGASGEFVLYEDDDAAAPRAVRTRFTFDWDAGTVTIHPAVGDLTVVPPVRRFSVVLVGAEETSVPGRSTTWDRSTASLTVDLGEVETAVGATVAFAGPLRVSDNDVVARVLALVDAFEVPFATKDRVAAVITGEHSAATRARAFLQEPMEAAVRDAVLEIVLARA
jgi:alpha-glucosidase (family GH31 glycosyl hydrolase)